ncbi:MAG: tRNA (adenosine(37)-N6)-threonylcarbamoyltransferase complex dimerization subunit type 1 TsaB [Candidatus Binatia bacterium]
MSSRAELILAVDTSGADAGVVLAGDGRVETALLPTKAGGFAQTEDLAGLAGALLATRGCTAKDLTVLGAVVGPGSYTGLRSGMAFLRGLAFEERLAAVAVGSLELLAWRGARPGESVLAVLAAGPGRYVTAAYLREDDSIHELAAPRIVEQDEFAGDLAECSRGLAAVVTEAAALAGDDSARRASASATVVEAARSSGLEFRVAGTDSLEQLALLVASRSRRMESASIDKLVPVYVGHARALPNRRRVAIRDAPE